MRVAGDASAAGGRVDNALHDHHVAHRIAIDTRGAGNLTERHAYCELRIRQVYHPITIQVARVQRRGSMAAANDKANAQQLQEQRDAASPFSLLHSLFLKCQSGGGTVRGHSQTGCDAEGMRKIHAV